MARPCKPASVLTDKSQTKAEIEERDKIEKQLRGDNTKLTPPKYLTAEQKKIFKEIVNLLKDSGVLGKLDTYILETTAIAIDRLHFIEKSINADNDLLNSTKFMASKDKYTKDFFRGCNELGLSPQSRAKIANISAEKNTSDPIVKTLKAAMEEDD